MGEYIKVGQKLGTTFNERADEMFDLIDTFYSGRYEFAKSAGTAKYGDDGYFNAIMGKELSLAFFSSDNTFTAIGSRPYAHEGMRIVTEQASYGLNSAGKFVGLGAGTIQDGRVPASVKMPVNEVRQPYKDLPFRYNYGLGLKALENKDDTSTYNDYVKAMSANYSDLADKTILRPVSNGMDVTDGIETSLNGIARCISSTEEIGTTQQGVEITADLISAYGGLGASKGDLYQFREKGAPNWGGQVVNAENATLSLNMLNELWMNCSINWKHGGSPNGKMWSMSNVTQAKLAALCQAQQVYLDSVFVQKDFNGVTTIPGGDYGLLVKSYFNIPIINDGNINFDYQNYRVSKTVPGDVGLWDLDHLWMRVLTPIELYSVDNIAILGQLQESNVITMRMETGIDSFIQHGRIINLADSY